MKIYQVQITNSESNKWKEVKMCLEGSSPASDYNVTRNIFVKNMSKATQNTYQDHLYVPHLLAASVS